MRPTSKAPVPADSTWPPASPAVRPAGRPQMPYVPGLDGLRAIAVILVLLYHADLRYLPGGFLGVEVFFVISGYLITSLLLTEWRGRGRIDITGFWLRRARRLLPAAYLMIVCALVWAVLFLPHEVAGLRRDAAAAAAYVTNWYLVFSQKSYFQIVGRPSLLQHLWSLAVEEQFYLLWPALFAAGMRLLQRRKLLIFTGLGAAASALLMAALFHPNADPSRIYYGTDTRAAGLLIGASLALAWPPARRPDAALRGKPAWPDAVALSALAVALGLCLGMNEFQPFLYLGGLALVAGATAVSIAAVTHPRARLSPRILEWGPLRWVGLRSYSLYLWHWPVFMVTRPHLDIALTGLPLLALRLAATVTLAELSYRYVETPIRRGALGRAWQASRAALAPGQRRLGLRWLLAAGILIAPSALLGLSVAAAQKAPTPSYLAVQAIHTVTTSEPTPAPAVISPTETLTPAPAALPIAGAILPALHLADEAAAPSRPFPTPLSRPQATAEPPLQVTAIGDSVMLGAAKELQKAFPHLDIDAAVNRPVTTVIDLLRQRRDAGQLGAVVIVHAGNNGPFTAGQLDEMMQVLADVPRVILINIKVPRRWQEPNNAALAAAVQRYPQARLVNWHAAAMDRPDLFWDDGIHLRPEGARFYTQLIVAQLPAH